MKTSWPELVHAAEALCTGPRRILGITGAPGAGKSVLAAALADELGNRAVLVGMDGFHLPNAQLARLGRLDRKGAPDTFDAPAYVELLRSLRDGSTTVCAPRFDRFLEEPVADAIAVTPDVPLVITEGNYLLLDDGAWADVAALLDECWYVAVDERVRMQRLVARHIAYGRTPHEALDRAYGSDLHNAHLIEMTRRRATRVVTVPHFEVGAHT